jgi:hypothetical protein
LTDNIWWIVQICASHCAIFLLPLVTSLFLVTNILLSTLFSNTVNICSFLNMISYPHKTTGLRHWILLKFQLRRINHYLHFRTIFSSIRRSVQL